MTVERRPQRYRLSGEGPRTRENCLHADCAPPHWSIMFGNVGLSQRNTSVYAPVGVPSLCPAHHGNSETQGFRLECLGTSYIDREPCETPFLSYPLARLGPVMGPYPRTLRVFGQRGASVPTCPYSRTGEALVHVPFCRMSLLLYPFRPTRADFLPERFICKGLADDKVRGYM